jgi:hypothetical protein
VSKYAAIFASACEPKKLPRLDRHAFCQAGAEGRESRLSESQWRYELAHPTIKKANGVPYYENSSVGIGGKKRRRLIAFFDGLDPPARESKFQTLDLRPVRRIRCYSDASFSNSSILRWIASSDFRPASASARSISISSALLRWERYAGGKGYLPQAGPTPRPHPLPKPRRIPLALP